MAKNRGKVDVDEAVRRQKRRERNRRSAQKCRERKVVLAQELKTQVDGLKSEQSRLSEELNSWLNEARQLYSFYQTHCPPGSEMPFFECLAEALSLPVQQQPMETMGSTNDYNHVAQPLEASTPILQPAAVCPPPDNNVDQTMPILSSMVAQSGGPEVDDLATNQPFIRSYATLSCNTSSLPPSSQSKDLAQMQNNDPTSPGSAALLDQINWQNFHAMAMSPEIDIKLPLLNSR